MAAYRAFTLPVRLAAPSLRPAAAAARVRIAISQAPLSTSSVLFKALPAGWTKGKHVTYNELKPITEQPSDNILVIDVREPDEVMQGNIPSSVNLPLSVFEQEMAADAGDFTRKNGFRKPAKDQPIIVYCRSGKRSQTALEALERHGYKHVRNYVGSYSDWASKENNQ